MGAALVKTYKELEFRLDQILRYAGCKDDNEQTAELVRECIAEVRDSLVYKVCYRTIAVSQADGLLDLEFTESKSRDLMRNLCGCDEAVLFGATIGLQIDRLIAKYGHVSPSKALVISAIGSERIESLCDAFNDDIKLDARFKGRYTRPRFSPGYGDLPLLMQREIFRALDCPRKIGLTLNESAMMSPSKSVTAFIGLSRDEKITKQKDCGSCGKTDCEYRS